MNIGERIRKARTERGMTQKELADKCGMFDSAIRRYELGTQKPKRETIERIATALEIDVFRIYVGDTELTMGDRIRKYRKDCGLTQSEVAKKIGVTKQTICKYEHNIITNIGIETIAKLSGALGVPIISLIYGGETA